MQSKANTGLNSTAEGLVGRRYELWIRQPLVRGYMASLSYSCYQLCNGESIRRPWCSQLDVYTSTRLDVVEVVLSSEGPEQYALLGVLAQDATLWVIVAEQHRR